MVNLKTVQKINFRPSNYITADEECYPEIEDQPAASFRSGIHLSKNNSRKSLEKTIGTASRLSLEKAEIMREGKKNFSTQPNENFG